MIRGKRPDYLLLENVTGLLSHNKGETFHTILCTLSDFPFTKADVSELDELREYVELAKTQALFETGEDAAECRAVLILVTCAYDWDGERNIVIAVR